MLLSGPANDERDMTKNQRALVDACFEEGQYEAGISLLMQLRSPRYRPSPSHIRQLLYIALYPPPDRESEGLKAVYASPSKIAPAKQKKSALVPTLTASEAARQCLTSFAATNTPASILRALPSYPGPEEPVADEAHDIGDEDEDSFISREATNIKQCKNCWAVLREGFINCSNNESSARDKSTRRRKSTWDGGSDKDSEILDPEAPAMVGPQSWPVLDWLLDVFEKDERLTENSGNPRYSPLLLRQIPPARAGTGSRWEADIPLDIVFYCLNQPEPSRRFAGARLMKLMVNLTSVVYFDAAIFTSAVFARLTAQKYPSFSEFFSVLPASLVGSKFKLALCRKYLVRPSGQSAQAASGPRFQGRIQPRARRRGGVQTGVAETAQNSKPTSSDPHPHTIASKLPVPPAGEVLTSLQASRADRRIEELKIKFEWIVTYGKVQEAVPPEGKDNEWIRLLEDGAFKRAVGQTFEETPGDTGEQDVCQCMKELLLDMLSHWQNIDAPAGPAGQCDQLCT
ncbi:hypothetical protein GLOTRDRAFT_58955 [Gloeophyllum trabeum ATCC 11539]|uniref:Uncharacterized protein n=1 Tax=Gloeophyllum trabeum (strain ATCC 11539 / FP-39264 / Madison 617) TaxID=670483 RepID=S7QDT6_GLOTA|nr:uncharacterized protein GLOTRDRAFT_58955 [Gloeophyllum trabeum ATCC 11539]EPQ57527.1 hypothetical protein GLOTRDRAFT_58955 [Gloeophyllum trabeum ATCC 11539]